MSAFQRFPRPESDCQHCPLNGRPKVFSTCGIPNPSVAIIGEAPGEHESEAEVKSKWEDVRAFALKEKGPFVGPSGGILKQAIGQAGMMWHTIYRMNVINCRPTNNKIDSEEANEAIKCCKPGFEAELGRLKGLGAKVLVPVGNTAMSALGIEGTVSRNRGSVYVVGKQVAVPTYHPSYILRGAIREEPVWIADLRKARDLSLKSYKPPKENFNIHPKLKDVQDFVELAITSKKLVACDIETDGGFNPDFNKITMIGLSLNVSDVLVIPLMRGGDHAREPYWNKEDEHKVMLLLKKLFKSNPFMFQNALFDVEQMAEKGLVVENVKHDTMLLHHAIHPELAHDLGYIVSIYGETPFWKDVTKGSKARMIELDEDTIRIYNARDTSVLHQILPSMLEDLKDVGTERTYYDWSMKLIWPLIRMKMKGVLVDQKQIKKLRAKYQKEYTKLDRQLRDLLDLPESFNFDSNPQLQFLLYGVKPLSLEKKKEERKEIESSEKRSKTTKKYLDLVAAIEPYEKVKPLYKTKARADNCDGEALVSIQQQAAGRLEALDFLKRQTGEVENERREIRKLLGFIELFSRFSEVSKMLGTYTKYPVRRDGRVHGSFLIHGTATGRLSAREPNLQNQPKSVRYVFVAPEGRVLIEGDYSNLELRVLAYVTEEPFLIDAFAKGQKIHKINCKLFWNIEEDDPSWEKKYRVTKSVIFGSNYGGGLQGLYKRAMADVPGMELSFQKFSAIVNAYFSKMSRYSGWQQSVRDTVTGRSKQTVTWGGLRWISNAFGRKRFFLGSLDEIEREALNTPIQGTAGDIANAALVGIDQVLLGRQDLEASIVCTVHDSILVECPKEKAQIVQKIMKDQMEREFLINGQKRRFPVDFKVGVNWGEMIESKED